MISEKLFSRAITEAVQQRMINEQSLPHNSANTII